MATGEVSGAAVYPGEDRPAPGARHSLGSFTSYEDAQRLVDRLSDDGFDVSTVAIVGCDLRTVEQVTGRLTTGRAALLGAAAGAWWGVFVGLVVALFSISIIGPLVAGLLFGAVFGAAFGAIGHAASGGRRDFSSVKTLQAGRYEVLISDAHAAAAERLLRR